MVGRARSHQSGVLDAPAVREKGIGARAMKQVSCIALATVTLSVFCALGCQGGVGCARAGGEKAVETKGAWLGPGPLREMYDWELPFAGRTADPCDRVPPESPPGKHEGVEEGREGDFELYAAWDVEHPRLWLIVRNRTSTRKLFRGGGRWTLRVRVEGEPKERTLSSHTMDGHPSYVIESYDQIAFPVELPGAPGKRVTCFVTMPVYYRDRRAGAGYLFVGPFSGALPEARRPIPDG